MTGLDPAKDVIVEIATLVTDDELKIVAEGPDLVVHQRRRRAGERWTRSSSSMHTRRACSTQIRASTVTLEEAGAPTLAFIKEHVPGAAHGAAVRQLDRHRPPVPRRLPARDRELPALPLASTCRP